MSGSLSHGNLPASPAIQTQNLETGLTSCPTAYYLFICSLLVHCPTKFHNQEILLAPMIPLVIPHTHWSARPVDSSPGMASAGVPTVSAALVLLWMRVPTSLLIPASCLYLLHPACGGQNSLSDTTLVMVLLLRNPASPSCLRATPRLLGRAGGLPVWP